MVEKSECEKGRKDQVDFWSTRQMEPGGGRILSAGRIRRELVAPSVDLQVADPFIRPFLLEKVGVVRK
jgi:hypothetical protein